MAYSVIAWSVTVFIIDDKIQNHQKNL